MAIELDKTELSVGKVLLLIVAIVGYVGWVYNSIIIPINQMQVSIAQINSTLSDNKEFQKTTIQRLDALEKLTRDK